MIRQQKEALRDRLQARLRQLSPATAADARERVRERLLTQPHVMAARHVAVYSPLDGEIDLLNVVAAIRARGASVYYPRYNGAQQQYEMVAISDEQTQLRRGPFGILEPEPELLTIDVDVWRRELLWFVPGIAFDLHGRRLGRGFGFYDRLLRGTSGVKLGVAHDWQIVPEVPAGEMDVRMDSLVTEARTIDCAAQCSHV